MAHGNNPCLECMVRRLISEVTEKHGYSVKDVLDHLATATGEVLAAGAADGKLRQATDTYVKILQARVTQSVERHTEFEKTATHGQVGHA